jgi:prepilin-type N-terminal cleavage/methylation domain-containing protein
MKRSTFHSRPGFTLVEMLMAAAVGGLIMAVVFSGAISMQRCFVAGKEFAEDKTNQSRLSDYVSLDLRRALTVKKGTGNTLLTVTIPDYYDETGAPRMPTIIRYAAEYGNPANPVTVTYERSGDSIYRREAAAPAVKIATDVEDFQILVQDVERVAKTQVTFVPRFSHVGTTNTSARTTLHNTIYLRNQRKDIP